MRMIQMVNHHVGESLNEVREWVNNSGEEVLMKDIIEKIEEYPLPDNYFYELKPKGYKWELNFFTYY